MDEPSRHHKSIGLSAHGEQATHWIRSPFFVGTAVGWLIGMLWWAGLAIAFALNDGRSDAVTDRLLAAPLAALPWAVAGFVVGAVYRLFRGYWVPSLAILGTVAGGVCALATNPFDGWLALTMPISCFAGTFAGLMAGGATQTVWDILRRKGRGWKRGQRTLTP